MNKTPAQILARLREIETMHPTRELLAERSALLSSVGRPPSTLAGCYLPEQWAATFVELHASHDEALILEWFSKFRDQVAQHTYAIGHADGKSLGMQDVARLVDLNKMLLAMMGDRRLADPVIRDDVEGSPPMKTSAYIRQYLRAMGAES